MATKPRPMMLGSQPAANTNERPNKAPEFFARLLNAVTVAHVLHFQQTGPGSYARHEALGSLYDGLSGYIDSLVEDWQGCHDTVIEDYPFAPIEKPADPVAFIEELYEYIKTARADVSDESHIQNQIDEICILIFTTRYKLKRLA